MAKDMLRNKVAWILGALSVYSLVAIGSYAHTNMTRDELKEDIKFIGKHSIEADKEIRESICQLTDAVQALTNVVERQRGVQDATLKNIERIYLILDKYEARTYQQLEEQNRQRFPPNLSP